MKTPEYWEKKAIDEYLVSIGAFIVKTQNSGFGVSGHADRYACIRGRFVGIEVKREGKGPTELQKRRISEIETAGGIALWGTSKKVILELREWLK